MSETQRRADIPGSLHRPFGGPTLIEAAEAAGTALFTMATPLPKDGSAPEWVTVFPKVGRIETRDGRAFEINAETLIAAFGADGIEIPVDVNHATDAAGMFGGEAPAVGWGTELRVHDGGLQVRVDWLDQGKTLLSARQYKYTSPSFYQDKGRATRLKALSLVTTPALGQQPALARAGHAVVAGNLRTVALALGLGEGAGETECLSAISALREGAVSRSQHDSVTAQLSALQATNHSAAVEQLIDGALKAMKITPAERDTYASLCATPAGLAQIEQLFAKKVPLMQPSGLDGRPVPGGYGAGLSEELPEQLSARATRYREAQGRLGSLVRLEDAVAYCHAHPTAGL